MRKKTRQIHLGSTPIGGDAPIAVQSMTNTDTRDHDKTLTQIGQLEAAGCEIIRCAVPDEAAAQALTKIRSGCRLPLIADIHFDHKLALAAVKAGVDGLRLNPGNIGSSNKVKEVVAACADTGLPIRVGVNGGSLEPQLLAKYGHATAEAMVESALNHIAILEKMNFDQIKVSLKASDVQRTVQAYRLLATKVDYPLHIGITEAGTAWSGTIKSAVGLGALLLDGIGDTLRVSLTGDPVEEVKVGFEILKSLGLRTKGPIFVSCPTCGRCEIDLQTVAEEVEKRLHDLPVPLTIAVMGCVVNGPGEAREADLGLAGGHGQGMIFKRGEPLRKVDGQHLADALVEEAQQLAHEIIAREKDHA